MRVPDKLPLKPLTVHTLIAQLYPNLVDIPFHLFDPPLTEPNPLPPLFHRSHMFTHRLKNRGISDGLMGLHHGQGFGRLLVGNRIQGRRLRHKVIQPS